MAGYPPTMPPPGYDPRAQRRYAKEQARAMKAAARAQAQQLRYQMRSMRRGSVLGPLLLITVGVVFLLFQTGHLDRQHFWDWYGHWWPLLLVLAGVVVLAEWAMDQYLMRDPQRPVYRRSLGGGVFVLLLIVGGAGFLAEYARMHADGNHWFYGWRMDPDSLDQFFGDKHESDLNLDFAFSGTSLAVNNPRGDVTVNGGSTDGQIHIAMHKQVYARTDSEAESKAQRLVPNTSSDGTGFSVNVPSVEGTRADLVISVPANAATTVTTNRGDIHVRSIRSSVSATANHGDVELTAITGQVNAHVNNSGSSISAHNIQGGLSTQGRADDLTVSDVAGPVNIFGEYFGTTHLQHIGSPVHFHTSRTDFQIARLDGQVEISSDMDLSLDQAVGPVVLTTRDRNINMDRVTGQISVTNRNGSINVTAAPEIGNITLEDRNGSVKLMLPEKAGFMVQASTTDGNIDTDFPLSSMGTENNKSLNGTVGAGGPLVRITTSHGDISLHHGEIAPLPPMPPMPPMPELQGAPAPPGAPSKITRTPVAPHAPPAPRAPRAQPAPPPPSASPAPSAPPASPNE